MIGKLTTWVFLALSCNFVVRISLLFDYNKTQYSHTPGPCYEVKGIEHGSEDIHLIDNGLAFITSGLRYQSTGSSPDGTKGKLFVVDLAKSEGQYEAPPEALELEIRSKSLDLNTFNPHGLSAWTSKGRVNLYVINHHPDGDTVECFTFSAGQKYVSHIKTIKDPEIRNANNLVALGPFRFYLTNDYYFTNPLLRTLEMYSFMSFGNVIYYDGTKGKVVDRRLLTPNGIAIDPDEKYLYVASPVGESIRTYRVKPDDSLDFMAEMSLVTSPDNIFVVKGVGAKDNEKLKNQLSIFVACHPVLHKLMEHLKDTKVYAPSQVLQIRPSSENHTSWTITEPYGDDGLKLSASTSVAYFKEQLLIGSVKDKLMWCATPDKDLL